MSKLNRSLLWTGFVVAVAACGDDVTVTPPPPPPPPGIRSVTVAPNPATLAVGLTLQFVASVTTDPGAATPTIAWSSSNPAVASVNASSGLALGVAPGTVAITATATSGTSTGAASATLVVGAAPACQITGVSVSPSNASINVNESFTAGATVTGSAACIPAQLAVTWNSLSPAIATVGLNTGLVTGVTGGNAVIRATSVQDATKSATLSVLVLVPSPATISIQAITQGGLGVPVNLASVAGQIEIAFNVDRGDKQLVRLDALIGPLVVASQEFSVQPSPAENAPAAAPVTIVLNVNTRQLRQIAALFVPVIFNGQTTIKGNLTVAGEPTPISSNAVPVLMNNSDAGIAPAALTDVATAAPEPFVDGAGNTWFKGSMATSFNYIAFSNRAPAGSTTALDFGCGGQTSVVAPQDPATGITVTNTWTCAATQGARNVAGPLLTTWAFGVTGPDGSALVGPETGVVGPPVTVPPGYSTVGAAFTIVGEQRWNLITPTPNALPGPFFVDNVAPTVTVAGQDDVLDPGFPGAYCGAPLDGVVTGCVGFQDVFDQQWINDAYTFTLFNAITNPTGDWLATEPACVGVCAVGGTGVDLTNSGVREVVIALPVPLCTGPIVTTGLDLAETVTSDGTPDGHRVCTFSQDNLANASTSLPSNFFGVDGIRDAVGNPTVRIAGTTAATPTIAPSTNPHAAGEVATTPNTTIFSIVDPFAVTGQWGVEAIDDRSGFNQNLVAGFPANQTMTLLNPATNPAAVIPCGLLSSMGVVPGSLQLSDFFVRADHMPPNGPAPTAAGSLDCTTVAPGPATGPPGYFTFSGTVTDRAGNSATITRNYAIDQYAAPSLASIGASTPFYAPGAPAAFFLFGSDDLEVIEADLLVGYPNMATVVGTLATITKPLSAIAGAARWDATLTNILAATSVTDPFWIGRVDFTCTGAAAPYASCTGAADSVAATAADYNNVGPAFVDDEQNATSVSARAYDVASQASGLVTTGLLTAQTTPDVAQQWTAVPTGCGVPTPICVNPQIISWRISSTAATSVVAQFVTLSSLVPPYFDNVFLAKGDVVAATTLIICGSFPASVRTDNGITRQFTYTTSDPAAGTPCALATGNYFAIGIKSAAALVTQAVAP